MKLQPGDLFGTENPMALGRMINGAQRVWSRDNASRVSHSGIIASGAGETIEALWSVASQDLFEAYRGKYVVIARMTAPEAQRMIPQALAEIRSLYMGRWYPLWRLPFHLFPPLAKYVSIKHKWVVCSELVARFAHLCGARHEQYMGTNPDTLADEWERWRDYRVLFAGVLPAAEEFAALEEPES